MSETDDRQGNLHDISTQWSKLQDVHVFVLRYANAIERYLQFLLRNEDDGREAAQAFLLRVVETGFQTASPDKGRFRHYLMRSVQNAAHQYQRQKQRVQSLVVVAEISADATVDPSMEQAWLEEWRSCILDRALKKLKNFERSQPNNLHWTVLTAAMENNSKPQNQKLESPELAAEVSERTGQTLTAEAFRKQLSRARRTFANLLIEEVRETLDDTREEAIREELQTAGLWSFIKDYV